MKSLLAYYIVILLPIPFFVLTGKQFDSSLVFVVLWAVYFFVWRAITDSIRLIQKGVIKKSEWWKVSLIPFARSFKYFDELYLNK